MPDTILGAGPKSVNKTENDRKTINISGFSSTLKGSKCCGKVEQSENWNVGDGLCDFM